MNPFNSKVLAIIRREYLQRVKSKWFLLSTIGLPLLFLGLAFISGMFAAESSRDTDPTLRIGVVDDGGRLSAAVIQQLRAGGIDTDAAPIARADLDGLARSFNESELDAFVLLPAEAANPGPGGSDWDLDEEGWGRINQVRLLARDNVPSGSEREIRDAVNRALVSTRLERAGATPLDPTRLTRGVRVDVLNVTAEGAGGSQDIFKAISFVLAFLFYMVLIVYGQMIIRSVIEEKTSDIVEVVISSVRPRELMLGKIIGVGAVGITQFAVWGLIIAGAVVFGLTAGAATLAEAGIDLGALAIPIGTILLTLAFLVLGYLLYAGMFAAAGATISSEQDAQQVSIPIIMLIVIPFIAAQGVIESPNGSGAVIMSLVPFFAPLLMPPRLLISQVPVWQWAASLLLLGATVLGAAWVAGRIYRVGILMKGQRPNLPEVLRWVHHG